MACLVFVSDSWEVASESLQFPKWQEQLFLPERRLTADPGSCVLPRPLRTGLLSQKDQPG